MEISIIIPTHDCAKYIGRAVRSALDQTFPRNQYEVIVVDDGSKDDTRRILRGFGDMIRVLTLKKNRGLPYARNHAIRNALGKFVVCLDADDYISNHLLQVEHLYLVSNNHMGAVSCDYLIVNDLEDVVERRSSREHPIACGIMFHKDRLHDIGLYDEGLLIHEDLDLRKRYLEKFSIYNIPLPLYRYRQHAGNLTKRTRRVDHFRKKLHEKHNVKDMHKHLKDHKNVKEGVSRCSL